MFRLPVTAIVVLLGALLSQSAIADEYSMAIGRANTGTLIPSGRVGLGIPVSIDKSWAELTADEQQAWRKFTDLKSPEIIPPFPMPNIRSLLRKLESLPFHDNDSAIKRTDEIFVIVRISEKGAVTSVDIMRGTDTKARELTDMEKILAYRYANALTNTQFSPALLNGKPVASAYPMLIRSLRVRH